jgi:hypothetical protein
MNTIFTSTRVTTKHIWSPAVQMLLPVFSGYDANELNIGAGSGG